jgi:hypothetical protein
MNSNAVVAGIIALILLAIIVLNASNSAQILRGTDGNGGLSGGINSFARTVTGQKSRK